MTIEIKLMETEPEIDGKGYVHYKAWQEAYAGLVDEKYLEGVTLEKCTAAAHRMKSNTLIAKDGERVIGFAVYGTYRWNESADAGEVMAIYTLSEFYGKGVGQALMNAALEKLSGFNTIYVWVLRGNERAIHFYEKFGYRLDGEMMDIMLGTPNVELRMIYTRSACGN